MSNSEDYQIYALSQCEELGKEIAKKCGKELSPLETEFFSDGEISVSFPETLRGKHVYLVGSTNPNADNLMEMLLALDASKTAGAYKVHVVSPYYGMARQDKKGKTRSALGARVVARCLEANGADSVICIDLHASQIQGFFSNNTPVIEIEGKDIFAPILKDEVNAEEWLICSPDAGGGKRAKAMKDQLGLGMVLMDKTRDKPNSIGNMVLIGDVKDKKVIIVDDMVDTAGTLCKSAEVLLEKGATEVYACIPHGILSGVAYERIGKSKLKRLYISDTIPTKEVNELGVKIPDNIKVITSSDTIAKVINATRNNSSINETIKNMYQEHA